MIAGRGRGGEDSGPPAPGAASELATNEASAPLPDFDDEGGQGADLAKLKRYFSEAEFLTETARQNALRCIDYYDSDQYTQAERAELEKRKQPGVVVNRVKPAINGMIGVTERGRSDPRAWPRNPGDDTSAEVATDVLRYIADFNRFKRVKQDCFLDMLVPGTMAALIGVDADLQVTITQVRWEEFFGDPRSRRKDWKDARYLGICKWMYADDVAALYPDKRGAIEATVENGAGGALFPAESYQDRPISGQGVLGSAWVDARQRRLMVVEMYWRERKWRRAVFTAMDVLEEGLSPYKDHKGRPDCPIEAMSAYVKRDNARYGAVWDMIGPQDEVNKRRSKALHLLSTSRIQVADPSAINIDADVARSEAARPDGVIPFGWRLAPNPAEFTGNMELLAEAKAEMERFAPNPAVLGRDGQDSSGRALLARQQAGLIELANLYGALEDWELRVYRQCWARAKQFWRAPQFIRVTDDQMSPKFVGLNQPVMGPPLAGAHPTTGAPVLTPNVLGYDNALAEMDVDIEVDAQPEVGALAQEQFTAIMQLVGANPSWQQQLTLAQVIQLSTIPHKRQILDQLEQASEDQQRARAQDRQVQMAGASAKIDETRARAAMHQASGFAHALNAVSQAHALHADQSLRGLEKGLASVGPEESAPSPAAPQTAAPFAPASPG